MTPSSSLSTPLAHARRSGTAARTVFVATVLAAGALVWLTERPPMIDLPQHAAQVALLRDLLLGHSAFDELLRINLLTPYLIAYGLALPLALVMPAAAALKMVLMLAYYAYVALCVQLRRVTDGDARLDWLAVPGFFGFAWSWGFVTFLVAAPLGLLFILWAWKYAQAPSRPLAVRIAVAGLALFFCHGMVFALAVAVGAALLTLRLRAPRAILGAGWPYLLLFGFALAFFVFVRQGEPPPPYPYEYSSEPLTWHHGPRRLVEFFIYPLGHNYGRIFVPLTLALMAVPWLLGLRPSHARRLQAVPLAVLGAIWLLVPSYAANTAFLYERFAIFTLPFYALLFGAPAVPPRRRWPRAGAAALPALCLLFLALLAARQLRFEAEARDYDRVARVLQPGQRALMMIFEPHSEAAKAPVYLHYAAWYSAEQHGLVDFNFAWVRQPMVRYRPGRLPSIAPGFEWKPQAFDWERHAGQLFRYFLVRSSQPLPPTLFANRHCTVRPIAESGAWKVYERKECRP